MYTRLAIALGASFRLASASPLLGLPLECPDLSILDNFQQPVSAVCSCFGPRGTSTSTVSTTTTTDPPLVTTTTTTTLEDPTVTTTTTLIPDAVTVVIPTTVTTTTLTCFTTGGIQPLLPPLLKRRGGNDWDNGDRGNNWGKSSSSVKPSSAAKSSSSTKKPSSTSSAKWSPAPSSVKASPSSWKASATPDKGLCPIVTGKPAVSGLVSAACSCIDAIPYLATTTVTTTFVSTNAEQTTTLTSSTTTTQTTTEIELGAIPTVLVTNTINVAAASATGIPFYYYNPLNPRCPDGAPYEGVDDAINGIAGNPGYSQTGTIQDLTDIGGGTQIILPNGAQVSGVQFGVVFQGYIFATDGPGVYTIGSRAGFIDNIGAVWTGDKAYANGWNGGNADYIAGFPNGGEVSVNLLLNEARPVTIVMMNAGSPSSSDFIITNPAGDQFLTTNYLFADCGGNFIP